jgi:CoA:oxalate CoA-transferase
MKDPLTEPKAEANDQSPLQGLNKLRVIEVSSGVDGAFCAHLMVDAGAQVVKVESSNKLDFARRAGPFPANDLNPEHSGLYAYLNAGKLGATINLETEAGRGLLSALLLQADILVTDYPLDLIESLNLKYTYHQSLNPGLLACAITPFGMTGPHRYFRSDDVVALSVGGLTAATPGFPDYVPSRDEEGPLRPDTFASGFISGAVAATAILEGLFARAMDGRGGQIDVSQQEAIASTMIRDIAAYSYAQIVSGRRMLDELSGTGYAPNIYLPCKDGMVVLVSGSEDGWKRMVKIMGAPEWANRPEFADYRSRAKHIDLLVPLLKEWTMTLTGQEFTNLTQGNGLPCAHVLSIEELLRSSHIHSRGTLNDIRLGDVTCKAPGPPFRIENLFGTTQGTAPRWGEHNRQIVCGWLGRSEEQLQQLHRLGAI